MAHISLIFHEDICLLDRAPTATSKMIKDRGNFLMNLLNCASACSFGKTRHLLTSMRFLTQEPSESFYK